MSIPSWLQATLKDHLSKQPAGLYSLNLQAETLLYTGIDHANADARLARHVDFESAEPILLRGIVVGDWVVRYSVYSGALTCERLIHPDLLTRIAEIRGDNIRECISQKANALSHKAFEALVTNVFHGAPWSRNVKGTGGTGDGGIDFMGEYQAPGINLTVPLIGQVKKLKGPAGSPDLRNFIGALTPYTKHSPVGVFVSRDGFTPSATQVARDAPFRILLYSLDKLIDMMLEEQIGVGLQSIAFPALDEGFWESLD